MPDLDIPGSCLGKAMDEDIDFDAELDIQDSPRHSIDAEEYADGFVEMVASMEATRPEIVRGIPMHRALQGCGRAIRGQEMARLYRSSRITASIDEFWSHSWHTSVWMKFCTMWFVNRSTMAAVCGMLGACLGLMGRLCGILPRFQETPGFFQSQWCVIFGCVGHYGVILLWKPSRLVFLDAACIDQGDELMKGEALISMGAILKSSSSLQVFWDASWNTRFWCVFELAAFLHGHEPEKARPDLRIHPTLMGPVLLIAHVGLCLLLLMLPLLLRWGSELWASAGLTLFTGVLMSFTFLAHVGRAFTRDLDTLQKSLAEFRIESAKCFCCDNNHVDETGEALICDRMVLLRCISVWFGSKEAFDLRVRGPVRKMLLGHLTSPGHLYGRIVETASPVMWLFLDRLAMFMTTENDRTFGRAVEALMAGLGYWLATIPTVVMVSLAMAYALRAKQKGVVWEALRAVVVVAVGGGLLPLNYSLEQMIHTEFTEPGNFFHLAVAQTLIFCGLAAITILITQAFSRARRYALALDR